MRPIAYAELVDHVCRLGIPDRGKASHAVRATIAVLGQALTDDEAAALARELTPDLVRVLDQNEYDPACDASEAFRRVGRQERCSPTDACEHVEIVARALGELLGERDRELRSRLARALPDTIARSLVPAEYGPPPPYAEPRHAEPHTLSRGRPGTSHPICTATPPAASRLLSTYRHELDVPNDGDRNAPAGRKLSGSQ